MQRYTPKDFLRRAPNLLLRHYFDAKGLLAHVPWDRLKETRIEPIHQAILELPEAERRDIGRDFRAANELASSRGSALLFRLARERGLDLMGPQWRNLNGHARALLVLLDHPGVFEEARHLARWEFQPRSSMDKRNGLPPMPPDTSQAALTRFAAAISEFYREEQDRGEHCKVEHFRRNGHLHYFFAYPSDYLGTFLGYEDDGELERKDWKPAFGVVAAFDERCGTLEMCAEGGRKVRSDLAMRFARSILQVDQVPEVLPEATYQLQGLLDRHFAFRTMPEENISLVRIKMLRARWPGGTKRSVSFDVDGRDIHASVHDLIDEVLEGTPVSREKLLVMEADIQAVFAWPDRRGRSIGFHLSLPSTCSLEDSPEELILKECLKRWGIDASES